MAKLLAERLGIPCVVGRPMRGLDTAAVDWESHSRGIFAEWAVCAGLATRNLDVGTEYARGGRWTSRIDFLPEHIKVHRARRRSFKRQVWLVGVVALGLAILGYVRQGMIAQAKAELAGLDQQISQREPPALPCGAIWSGNWPS